MKKLLMVLILVLAAFGCATKPTGDGKIYNFMDITFENGEERIYFGKDGHFSHYYSNGSPVGDSDLCEEYVYDDESKKIEVICDLNSGNIKYEMVNYDENHITLKMNNKNITFERSED